VSADPIYAHETEGRIDPSRSVAASDAPVVLGAVREDIRQTLRMGWLDPAFEALLAHPAFLTAGWSAVRPNVGRSFVSLAKSMREEATSVAQSLLPRPVLRHELAKRLSQEEVRRVEEAARAIHLSMPKVQIVVHALYRAARRERLPGKGHEEPPIRRGVPEWQRWMAAQPVPEAATPVIEQTARYFSLPASSAPLRLFARWPDALTALAKNLRALGRQEEWNGGVMRLRRTVLAGIGNLPHPVELQWPALQARGLLEEDRDQIVNVLAEHDAAMAVQTMMSTCAWMALGAPQGGDG
jgi:hypothetical protein